MTRAFSLVELSIVLVILGLLTGGILAGQSLIRAAELRSVTTEYQKHIAAFNTFRDKYFALPGDMTNATAFWTAQHATPATCAALITAATGTATCNGDGNGQIADPSTHTYETHRAWQHLANAGLIEGSYSGVTTSGVGNTFGPTIGVNTPASKLSNSGYTVRRYPAYDAAEPLYFAGGYGNLLWFGTANASYTSTPVLKTEEAWNIDTKLDDGRPAFGRILVPKNIGACITSTTAATSEYNLIDTGARCPLMLLLGM